MAHEIISNFESESAEDFLSDLSINGYGLIGLSLEKITDTDNRPSIIECEEAIIACEIVAAVLGHAAHDLPGDVAEWIEMFLPSGSEQHIEVASLAEKAADVLDLLVSDSELRDLWEEDNNFEGWFQSQVELQKRILD